MRLLVPEFFTASQRHLTQWRPIFKDQCASLSCLSREDALQTAWEMRGDRGFPTYIEGPHGEQLDPRPWLVTPRRAYQRPFVGDWQAKEKPAGRVRLGGLLSPFRSQEGGFGGAIGSNVGG